MTMRPEFSIILPVCHGGSFLRSALRALWRLDFPPALFEVLVAGADEDNESREIVEDEAATAKYNVRYIECIDSNRSRKLNAACAVARGRVLAFADDDCIFLPDWLQKLSEVLEREPEVGVVGGKDELESNGSAFDIALDSVLNSFSGTGGLRSAAGPRVGKYYPKLWNMAVPHDVALKVALKTEKGVPHVFNESLTVHEDVDLAERIEHSGKRIVFVPEVRIRHYRDTTLLSFVRNNFNIARTSRALGVHRLPHVALATFVFGTPALAVASFFLYPLRIVLLIFMGMYIATLLASAIRGFRRTRNLQVLAIIPWLLVSLHLARGLGYLFPWRSRMEVNP